MRKLISVRQAAELANVSCRTIYYHIHNSNKLQYIWGDKQYYVDPEQLKTLYAATEAGTKQAKSCTTYNPASQEQTQKLIAEAQAIIERLQQVSVA